MPIKRIPQMPAWFDAYISSLPDYKVDELMAWSVGAMSRVVYSSSERVPVMYDAGQELYDKLRKLAGLSERLIAKHAKQIQYQPRYQTRAALPPKNRRRPRS